MRLTIEERMGKFSDCNENLQKRAAKASRCFPICCNQVATISRLDQQAGGTDCLTRDGSSAEDRAPSSAETPTRRKPKELSPIPSQVKTDSCGSRKSHQSSGIGRRTTSPGGDVSASPHQSLSHTNDLSKTLILPAAGLSQTS